MFIFDRLSYFLSIITYLPMKKFYSTSAFCGLFLIFLSSFPNITQAQTHSVAKQWTEVMLNCIRKDAARPTVQARNLCHASVTMFDCWAAYDDQVQPFLLGNTWGAYTCPFDGIPIPDDVHAAREKAISYAMYRLLYNRYQNSPGWIAFSQGYVNTLMNQLGYDPAITSTNYTDGDPAKLGNYIAQQVIAFGYQDGSNQIANYANQFYQTVNGNIWPQLPGNPECYDPNRWQPLSLSVILDQNGFPLPNGAPALSAEWGNLVPFALTEDDRTVKFRNGNSWNLYHDPGPPPYLDTTVAHGLTDPFKWGYVMNIIWASHHTTADGVMIDASPNSIGNVPWYPESQDFPDYQNFYDLYNGGDPSEGHTVNPKTGLPYAPQIVPRGDYTRVLSEFWADGPASETPPGHWFTIVNYVTDHPDFVPKWMGQGEELDPLEFDVLAYFALGGALHDAAISCWSAKGFYDYTRPIMAVRYMADRGQCSDPQLPHYHPAGLPLIPGYIELVQPGDPLAGDNDEHVNKIKIWSWLSPPADPINTVAGVGWMLGENWWTFQRNTFVTPPFPGYYSGHSTYSRAAAEAMTLITGDPYFPGGMSEFHATANQYLLAEDGPSVDVVLQWATYRDASDQCSLSRIYGGLHPPQDDIPGRRVGMIVGPEAFNKAQEYITAGKPRVASIQFSDEVLSDDDAGNTLWVDITFTEAMNTAVAPVISLPSDNPLGTSLNLVSANWESPTWYRLTYDFIDASETLPQVVFKVASAQDLQDKTIFPAYSDALVIDTRNPLVSGVNAQQTVINDALAQSGTFAVQITFDEAMNTAEMPVITFTGNDPSGTLAFNAGLSSWTDDHTFQAVYGVSDINEELDNIDFHVQAARDANGNLQVNADQPGIFLIDTRNPGALVSTDDNLLGGNDVGVSALTYTMTFDEPMDINTAPVILFPDENPLGAGLQFNPAASSWIDATTYHAVFDLTDEEYELFNIDIAAMLGVDLAGNAQLENLDLDEFSIDTRNPEIVNAASNDALISDANIGNGELELTFIFQEPMNTGDIPAVLFSGDNPLAASLVTNGSLSGWEDTYTYRAVFDVLDAGEELYNIQVSLTGATDLAENQMLAFPEIYIFSIDTRNPVLLVLSANTYEIVDDNIGDGGFQLLAIFDEEMSPLSTPVIQFPDEDPSAVINYNAGLSAWLNPNTFQASFDVGPINASLSDIDVRFAGLFDHAGNPHTINTYEDFFSIQQTVGTANTALSSASLMPNPVESGKMVHLVLTDDSRNRQVQLISTDGKLVAEWNAITGPTQLNISTQGLAQGMYYIKVTGDQHQKVFKLVIQ